MIFSFLSVFVVSSAPMGEVVHVFGSLATFFTWKGAEIVEQVLLFGCYDRRAFFFYANISEIVCMPDYVINAASEN